MSVTQTQMFEDQHPLVRSCAALNELRLSGEIPDLTLELKDGCRMHVHRIILAARIPHLRADLRGALRNHASVLRWPSVPLSIANSLIQYVYTGQMEMTQSNVGGLVAFSRLVQLPILEEWGTKFMLKTLSTETLATTWELARSLNIQILMDICLRKMKAQFESFMYSRTFASLPADTVLTLLRSADLPVSSEEQVFAAVARWTCACNEAKEDKLRLYVPEMLKEIQWEQTTADFRDHLLHYHPIFKKSTECAVFMARVVNWIGAASHNKPPCPFNQRTRPCQSIFVFGKDRSGDRSSVLRFNSQMQNKERRTHMDLRWNASYSVVGANIFVVGGQTSQKTGTTRVHEFVVRERRWRERARLATRRQEHAAAVVMVDAVAGGDVDERMLIGVFGGCFKDGTIWTRLASCEVYDVKLDIWYKLPDMHEKRVGAAATCLLGDSRVFVFGGRNDAAESDSVEFCQLGADWQEKARSASTAEFWIPAAPMTIARMDLAVAPFRGKILVAGGQNSEGQDVNVVEVFSPPDIRHPLGQWTKIADMNQPRRLFTLLTAGDAVYALGGSDEQRNTVETFAAEAGSVDLTRDFTSWTWATKSPVESLKMICGAASVRT